MTATCILLIVTFASSLTSIVLTTCTITYFFARRRLTMLEKACRDLERHPTALWEVDT